MLLIYYKTKCSFEEIIEKYERQKISQSENLFGCIEEFDYKESEIIGRTIVINRQSEIGAFRTGNGEILLNFTNVGEVEIGILSSDDLLKRRKKDLLIFSILFLIFLIYQFYLASTIHYFFSFFILFIGGIRYMFLTIMHRLNINFLKDYALRWIKNLDS